MTVRKGNINHAVCRWCYDDIPFNELCLFAKFAGIAGIDLVGPMEWPVLQQYGLVSSMCNGAEISLIAGWNTKSSYSRPIENYTKMIPLVAKAGYKNLICFSGNRNGLDDETELKNRKEGVEQVLSIAEHYDVTLCMELLNSSVNHLDYQCDNTSWGAKLCDSLSSEHFKLHYDIYHMQISEGDIIRTIEKYHSYFAHYHTGGGAGRHEISYTQELNYPAIMNAIVKTGFKRFVAQEFIPTHFNSLASLEEGISICDV